MQNFNFETNVKNAKSEFATFEPVTSVMSPNICLLIQVTKQKVLTKLLRPAISDSLRHIFNQSINLSSFPGEWKTARVMLLLKKWPIFCMINCTVIYSNLHFQVIVNLFFKNFILWLQHYYIIKFRCVDWRMAVIQLSTIKIDMKTQNFRIPYSPSFFVHHQNMISVL